MVPLSVPSLAEAHTNQDRTPCQGKIHRVLIHPKNYPLVKTSQFCHLPQIPTKRQNGNQKTNSQTTTLYTKQPLIPHARPDSEIPKYQTQTQIVLPPRTSCAKPPRASSYTIPFNATDRVSTLLVLVAVCSPQPVLAPGGSLVHTASRLNQQGTSPFSFLSVQQHGSSLRQVPTPLLFPWCPQTRFTPEIGCRCCRWARIVSQI